jgi:hypothetical protein
LIEECPIGYASLLKQRPEVLSGVIEGIIDLANLADSRRRKLEDQARVALRTLWRDELLRGPTVVLPDLTLLPHRSVAMIRGRIHTHPPGPASSRLYKHGGLSLMEILTPWIVLAANPT